MSSSFGVVGVCGISVTIVFIDNVHDGRDPFPALVAGGLFTGGCVLISEFDTDMAMALAVVFLLANLLSNSNSVLGVMTKLVDTSKQAQQKTHHIVTKHRNPTVAT